MDDMEDRCEAEVMEERGSVLHEVPTISFKGAIKWMPSRFIRHTIQFWVLTATTFHTFEPNERWMLVVEVAMAIIWY